MGIWDGRKFSKSTRKKGNSVFLLHLSSTWTKKKSRFQNQFSITDSFIKHLFSSGYFPGIMQSSEPLETNESFSLLKELQLREKTKSPSVNLEIHLKCYSRKNCWMTWRPKEDGCLNEVAGWKLVWTRELWILWTFLLSHYLIFLFLSLYFICVR